MEHNLTGRMTQYPLIIIPDCCDYLDPAFLTELKTYLNQGGKLLIIGPKSAGIFAGELGIQSAETLPEASAFISADRKIGSIRSEMLKVKLTGDTKVLSSFYSGSDFRDTLEMAASSIRSVGKGKIAACYFNAGKAYWEYKTPAIRDFLTETVRELMPPVVEVHGSHLVHVALNQLNGKMIVNLINTAGEHTNPNAIGYDQVPALHHIRVSFRPGTKISKVIQQPEGKELEVYDLDGKPTVSIGEIALHEILEVY
jgi:hypothetical protein